MTLDEIQPAMETMKSWGFNLRIGKTVGKRDFIFGGTDAERLLICSKCSTTLRSRQLCVPGAVMDVSGSLISWTWKKFTESPKWIIGFSDITVIHAQLNHQFHIASIHSKMCNSFPEHPEHGRKGSVGKYFIHSDCIDR